MNMNKLIAGSTGVALMVVCGCVSAERIAEYNEWQASVDGVASVSLTEFEAKYKTNWRSREGEERAALEFLSRTRPRFKTLLESDLASKDQHKRERAERWVRSFHKEHQATYESWLASEDKVEGVTREVFDQKYYVGWRDMSR